MLAYGFEVDSAPTYGVAVEVALDAVEDAAAHGRDVTTLAREALSVGATERELDAVLHRAPRAD